MTLIVDGVVQILSVSVGLSQVVVVWVSKQGIVQAFVLYSSSVVLVYHLEVRPVAGVCRIVAATQLGPPRVPVKQ